MKTVTYMGGGPDVVSCGAAGQFVKGVAQNIDDDALADQLLGKNSLVFEETLPESSKSAKTAKQLEG